MKVIANVELCEGHGECVIAAPEVFDLDDSGDSVVVLVEEPSREQEASVMAAVSLCPVAALRAETT